MRDVLKNFRIFLENAVEKQIIYDMLPLKGEELNNSERTYIIFQIFSEREWLYL